MRLNGRPFTAMKLVAGDRLSIGPMELEVFETLPLQTDAQCDQAETGQELEPQRQGIERQHQQRENEPAVDLESTKPARERSPIIEPPPKPPDHDDEESIDEYMERLMERVRAGADDLPYYSPPTAGQETEPEPGTPAAGVASPVTQPASQARNSSDSGAIVRPAAVRRPCLEKISLRAAAPESEADLSAMRELANVSARTAISRHRRRKLILTSRTKLAVASVALACCGGLAFLWWKAGSGFLGFYAAVVSLLIAAFWGVEYAIVVVRLIFSRNRVDWNKVEEKLQTASGPVSRISKEGQREEGDSS